MIKASKITHRGEERIMLEFAYDKAVADKIRQIPGAAWSRTHRAWLIPDVAHSRDQLLLHFPGIILPLVENQTNKVGDNIPRGKELIFYSNDFSVRNKIRILSNARNIRIKCPKSENGIQFFRSIKYCYWKPDGFYWEMPNSEENNAMVTAFFGSRAFSIEEDTNMQVCIKKENNGAIDLKSKEIEPKSLQKIEAYISLLRNWMNHKRYSNSTVETYCDAAVYF